MDLTLADILEIENSAELATLCCPTTGILLWPSIRNRVIRDIISSLLYSGRIDQAHDSGISAARRTTAAIQFAVHNVLHRREAHAQVCLMFSGRGAVKGDIWRHPFNDALYLSTPSPAFMLEDHFAWVLPGPRKTSVHYHMPYQALAAIRGKMPTQRDRRLAAEVVELVVGNALNALRWDIAPAMLETYKQVLAGKIAAMPLMFDAYRLLLGRGGVRLLVAQSGCYGPAATIISAAKSLGIKTAEFQHGAITKGHDAYNVAPAMFASPHYRQTLPETLLCFGSWWTDQVRLPIRTLAVGSPTQSDVALPDQATLGRRNTILVLGDGVDTQPYLDLCSSVAPKLATKGLRLLFRPHPLERHHFACGVDHRMTNFSIDTNPDLQASFETAYAVVAEASTGLFDAIGHVSRIFTWNTPKSQFNMPAHPFEKFSCADELVDRLISTRSSLTIDREAIFKSGWASNYAMFVASQIG